MENKMSVYVVDDSTEILNSIKEVFKNSNYRIIGSAANGGRLHTGIAR